MNTTHTKRKFNSIEEIEDTFNLYIKDNDLIDDENENENYDTIVEQVLKIYNGEFSEDYSDIDIENVDVLRWLSGYYGSVKKDNEKHDEICNKLLAVNNIFGHVYVLLSIITNELNLERYNDALEYIQTHKLEDINPEYPIVWFNNLACIYMKTNNNTQALCQLREVCRRFSLIKRNKRRENMYTKCCDSLVSIVLSKPIKYNIPHEELLKWSQYTSPIHKCYVNIIDAIKNFNVDESITLFNELIKHTEKKSDNIALCIIPMSFIRYGHDSGLLTNYCEFNNMDVTETYNKIKSIPDCKNTNITVAESLMNILQAPQTETENKE
jgi:tetratricopeptide (TPR) repeat protein